MYEIEEVQNSEDDGMDDGVNSYISCQPFHPSLHQLLTLVSYRTTSRSIAPRLLCNLCALYLCVVSSAALALSAINVIEALIIHLLRDIQESLSRLF